MRELEKKVEMGDSVQGRAGAAPDDVARLTTEAHAELVRVDGKAQGVLTVAALVFSAGAAVVGQADLPTVARHTATAGIAAAAVAVLLLLAAIRPNLSGGHGFVRLARLDLDSLAAAVGDEVSESSRLRRLQWTARATARKYRRLRQATSLLYGAVVATLVTVVLALAAAL